MGRQISAGKHGRKSGNLPECSIFALEADDCYGTVHPGRPRFPESVLLICAEIQRRLEEGNIELQEDECIAMPESTFRDIIVGSRRKWKDAWSKEYGEMDEDRLVETILKYMEDWMMADRRENQIVILPAVGRLAGAVPGGLQRRRRRMSERWKMNRIGFVNFWLYDEEDFEFEDGKLLLRGQNGSGKSITTQSFIPFVLDGDRTPSRLDPFGSSDRRMEYYFLGEEGKEESTGYLFLEFWKEDSGEYRTIGIGQKAKRGKPMDFWGFVILDGRRVGYDPWLYKEVGSNKIPRISGGDEGGTGGGQFFHRQSVGIQKACQPIYFRFPKRRTV